MDQKHQDESNDVILTTMGHDDDIIEQKVQQRFSANIVLTSNLKKKNRLGFFYKRIVTLTDEPKLYYLKETKERDRHKHINLDPETTRLERLDKTKFKILDLSRNKKLLTFVFRCHDA